MRVHGFEFDLGPEPYRKANRMADLEQRLNIVELSVSELATLWKRLEVDVYDLLELQLKAEEHRKQIAETVDKIWMKWARIR
jgi:RNAse (barnase) inhibitor barstar